MKNVLLYALFILLPILTMIFYLYILDCEINSKLGKKIIINKDTVLILDYSHNSYILSNGMQINEYIIDQFKTINK